MKRYAIPAVLALATVSPAAHAQAEAGGESPPPAGAADRRDESARFELGYRGVFVTNAGYNPFSKNDYFSSVSLTLSRTIATRGRFSFAPGLSWDYGASDATARGDPTSLTVHRLTLPAEGRARFGQWGYAFLRVSPGAALETVEVHDASAPGPLTKSLWLFACDASAGYAFPVPPVPQGPARTVRAWVQGDAGYSWVADDHLDLSPGTPNGAPVALAALGLRGAFVRLALAVSY